VRHIEKGQAPEGLDQYRQDGGDYQHLYTEVKSEIRTQGYVEQGGLCAFCCGSLSDDARKQIIAHLVPRDANVGDPRLELTYANMVISCTGRAEIDQAPAAPSDHHSCDRLQRNRRLPVTPLQPDCQSRFTYDTFGRIHGSAADGDAKQTIEILGLDCMRLQLARKAKYEEAVIDFEMLGSESFKTEILGHNRFPLETFLPFLEFLFPD